MTLYRDLNGCVGERRGLTMPEHIRACDAVTDLDDVLFAMQARLVEFRARFTDHDMRLCGDDFSTEETEDVRRFVARLEPLLKAMEDV